jgi:transcriptional regulator with XRE-family HTH domain
MNKEESKKQFGKNLKKLRTEKGLSQEELARALGFKNRSSINKIEIGRSNIPTDKIKKTAEVLGISPLDLFQTDGEEIKAMLEELTVMDVEDLKALHAASEAPGAMFDMEENTEKYFATRTRGVIDTKKPEYASPKDLLISRNALLDTYMKLSSKSQDELFKYAEYLLAREKNK